MAAGPILMSRERRGSKKPLEAWEALGGVRQVQIYGPDGAQIAAGSLTIAADGDRYSLTWSVSEGGKESVFTGVGLIDESGSLAACFQEKEPLPQEPQR